MAPGLASLTRQPQGCSGLAPLHSLTVTKPMSSVSPVLAVSPSLEASPAQKVPLRGRDVGPHTHGVPQGSPADILEGHRLCLRDGGGPSVSLTSQQPPPHGSQESAGLG